MLFRSGRCDVIHGWSHDVTLYVGELVVISLFVVVVLSAVGCKAALMVVA